MGALRLLKEKEMLQAGLWYSSKVDRMLEDSKQGCFSLEEIECHLIFLNLRWQLLKGALEGLVLYHREGLFHLKGQMLPFLQTRPK